MNIDLFIFLARLAMIKVSDVDKYSHSQFISGCLARGCRRQHPSLITPETWGMMLEGRGRGRTTRLLGLGQGVTLNPSGDTFTCLPDVKDSYATNAAYMCKSWTSKTTLLNKLVRAPRCITIKQIILSSWIGGEKCIHASPCMNRIVKIQLRK